MDNILDQPFRLRSIAGQEVNHSVRIGDATLYLGDVFSVITTMPDESVNCVVTSPPYWGLRDYGVVGQLGLEATPGEYVEKMVAVFREVRRVLREDGTLWLNLGDSYNAMQGKGWRPDSSSGKRIVPAYGTEKRPIPPGLKPKDLVGIPWRVAFALQADDWYLRSDIIWAKPNPMPESVTDRPTKAHEYIFLLSKSAHYFYDAEAIREGFADERMGNPGAYKWSYANNPATGKGIRGNGGGSEKLQAEGWNRDGGKSGRNRRTVWTIATEPYPEAHFATFPRKLVQPCILAGCPVGGTVLDPFGGSGTTAEVALEYGRRAILIELNPAYVELQKRRIEKVAGRPMLDFTEEKREAVQLDLEATPCWPS
jgi:DNA modification methylase